jgi:uncharacterized protein (DUF1330 family)
MKVHYTLALCMLAGAALLVAAAVQGVHAQTKTPVSPIYLVVETDLMDIKKLTEYDVVAAPKIRASIRAFGGQLVVAPQQAEPVEGEAPKSRMQIIAWDSLEKMQAWRNSPEFKDARKIADKYAKYRSFTLVGLPQ